MKEASILLVEDNPDHESLTIRALKKAHVMNDILVAHDGAEAIDYLIRAEWTTGASLVVDGGLSLGLSNF